MWIESLEIYGFGKLSNITLTLTKGVNLIEGLNETGKSTLKAFIQSILFGFESRKNPHLRYEPRGGGRFGGLIRFVDQKGNVYSIERVYQQKVSGDVQITLPSGDQVGEEYLPILLQQIDETVYQQVFSFGLNELQQLESLQDQQINSYLYHAGTGMAKQIVKMNQELMKKEQELFKVSGKKSKINLILQEMDENRVRTSGINNKLRRYGDVIQEISHLGYELLEIDNHKQSLEEEYSLYEKANHYVQTFQRIKEIKWRLKEFEGAQNFPERGIERLELFESRINQLSIEKRQLEGKQSLIRQQLEQVNKQILSDTQKQRIVMIRDQFPIYKQNKERWKQLLFEKKNFIEQMKGKPKNLLQWLRFMIPGLGFLGGFILFSQHQWLSGSFITLFSLLVTGEYYRFISQIKQQTGISFFTIPSSSKYSIKQFDHLNQMIDSLREEIVRFEDHLMELDGNSTGSIEEVVYYWLRQLEIDQEYVLKKSQWLLQIEDIISEIQKISNQIEMEATNIRELFQYTGVQNKEEYYVRASQNAECYRLQAELKQLDFSIRNSCKTKSEYILLVQLLENNDNNGIKIQFQQLQNQREESQKRVKDILEKKGELQNQVKEMEEDESLTVLQQEYNNLQTRLGEYVKERVKTSLTKHILLKTMKIYETEKQPHVIRNASEYFRLMTNFKYERVFAPIDEAILKVLRNDGQIFEPQYLSRGTQEQLFIAMRFALIEEFTKKVELPLIFDDIFVNFDHVRLEHILKSLNELSKNHQILFFTCHFQLHSKMKETMNLVHYISLDEYKV